MSIVATKFEPDVAAPRLPAARSVVGETSRYFAASLAALALDSTLLWVGVSRLALSPWFAGAIAYAAGLVLVYLLSVRWIFTERTLSDRRSEFVVFAAIGVVGLFANSFTLFVATSLGFALPVAKVLSAGTGFTANFVSRKVLLFSGSSK